MPDQKLVGQNYTPPDLVAKVTGRAKYAEDYRVDGMLFAKLLLSPMPHARVVGVDTRAALAMPGVKAILTADDLPDQFAHQLVCGRAGGAALTGEKFDDTAGFGLRLRRSLRLRQNRERRNVNRYSVVWASALLVSALRQRK